MKASVLFIEVFCAGLNLVSRRKIASRVFSSFALEELSSSPCPVEGQDDSIAVSELVDDFITSPICKSSNLSGMPTEFSPEFSGNLESEFFGGDDSSVHELFPELGDNDACKRIKLFLKSRGWNLNSQNNSCATIELSECNIIRILRDLYEESTDATLPLFFFRWSEWCTRSKHRMRTVCTLIHILISGNMNHRAMDLIRHLVKETCGEEQWVYMLFDILRETRTERGVLVTAYSMVVDCYVRLNMIHLALKLIGQMKCLSMFPSMGVCNTLLRRLLQSDQIELAWDFLEEIQGQGFGLNASIISLFIHNYCGKGNIEAGWKLLLEAKNEGIIPDIVAYTILINCLCKMALLREATSMLFNIKKMGMHLDSVVIASIVDGFCKVGNSRKAVHILNVFDVYPNVHMYNSFISMLCSNCDVKAATELFLEMSKLGLVPDCFSYTTIMGGYCKNKEMHFACMFLGVMFKRAIKPSVVTYTTLMQGYCNCRDMEEAESIFQNMIVEGLVPDVVAYNILMDGYGKKGHLHKAFGLLDRMRSAQVPPDTVTYNSLIHGLIIRGFVSEAKVLLDELVRRGFSPDVVTFADIVSGLTRKENFEEAFFVWFYMSDHQMKPDVVTCCALLNGYCKASRMAEASTLFRKMLDIGLVPDAVLYNTLIHGFCRVGSIEEALDLIKMMTKNGINPDVITHRSLVLGYGRQKVQDPVQMAALKIQLLLMNNGFRYTDSECSENNSGSAM